MKTFLLSTCMTILCSLSGTALAARYNCLPVQLGEEAKRLYVECAEPNGSEGGLPRDAGHRIRVFSLPKSDAEAAKRFGLLIQTALVAGLVVQFEYTSGNYDAAIGCNLDDCRLPNSFSLLAPSTSVRVPYVEWPSSQSVAIAQGEWKVYGPFSISEFRKLVVSMTGTGDADLYVRKDDPPAERLFTCRPYLPTSNESCTIAPPVDPSNAAASRGTYYVGVKGKQSGSFLLTVSIQAR